MKISTQTDTLFPNFGIDEGIRIISQAGFDAADFSMFWLTGEDQGIFEGMSEDELVEALTAARQKYNLPFNQAHAPFPSYRFGQDEYNAFALEKIRLSVRIAGRIGAQQIIVHPIACPEGVDQKSFNIEFYNGLKPLCEEFCTKVALENMFAHDPWRNVKLASVCSFGKDLAQYVDELDPRYFTACLDVGHSGLVGDDAARAIRVLGHDRLTCLHVHDNNYIDDLHMPPMTARLDWTQITAALRDISYSGDLTLEDDGFISKLPRRAMESATRLNADIAAHLRDMTGL